MYGSNLKMATPAMPKDNHDLKRKQSLSIFGANIDNTVNNINYNGELTTSHQEFSLLLTMIASTIIFILIAFGLYLFFKKLTRPRPSPRDAWI